MPLRVILELVASKLAKKVKVEGTWELEGDANHLGEAMVECI